MAVEALSQVRNAYVLNQFEYCTIISSIGQLFGYTTFLTISVSCGNSTYKLATLLLTMAGFSNKNGAANSTSLMTSACLML